MLSNTEIEDTITDVAKRFPVKSVSYFGSYAEGHATDESDLDVLVEFKEKAVSLLVLIDFKYQLEDALGVKVDVVHYPLPAESHIEINKVVSVYAA
jgi:predicted nucleotidyltransferase